MTEKTPQPQKEYIITEEDLNCLHDYMTAAIIGEDITELPRLWNQEVDVIRSNPAKPPAPESPSNTLCEYRYSDQPGMKTKCKHPKRKGLYCERAIASLKCPAISQESRDTTIRNRTLDMISHEIEQAPEDEHDENYWRGIEEVQRIIDLHRTPTQEHP